MCGINGFIAKAEDQECKHLIQKMNADVKHRGPDSHGYFIQNKENNAVVLGMQRLSIIDLATGDQPLYNKDKTLSIVMNGEIYNYKVLKAELERKGCAFQTQSDTEVVLQLFELEGIACLEKLDGMFAFAIHDQHTNKLWIARDRLGEKPLYFLSDNERFIFASELKSITNNFVFDKNLDLDALNIFLSFTFIPAPYTIYKSIHKLLPAHYLEIDTEDLHVIQTKYWDIDLQAEETETDYSKASKKLTDLVYNSVNLRLIADVPVGVFLSGGVDSSIIAAIMADLNSDKKIETFSVGFNDKNFDESFQAKSVAKHINANHHSFILNPLDLIEEIDKIILNFDEPFADSSALPAYFIAKMTRQHVKVALTGDGGDEAFGGYNRYLVNYFADKYNELIPTGIHQKIINPLLKLMPQTSDNRRGLLYKFRKLTHSLQSDALQNMYRIICLGFNDNQLQQLLINNQYSDSPSEFVNQFDKNINHRGNITRARYLDKNISLEGDMLVKVDRTSMLASLECRAPFLDHKLFEFSNTLPETFLIKGFNKKRILKDSFKHLLPVGHFKFPKTGFGIPVGNWLRNELKPQLLLLTETAFLQNQHIFEVEYVQNMVNAHCASKEDHTFQLWAIYCFQTWWKANIA